MQKGGCSAARDAPGRMRWIANSDGCIFSGLGAAFVLCTILLPLQLRRLLLLAAPLLLRPAWNTKKTDIQAEQQGMGVHHLKGEGGEL